MKDNHSLKTYMGRVMFYLTFLIAIYVVLLWLAYLIPDSWIEQHRLASIRLINSEPKRWMVWSPFEATKLDTFTDKLMFQKLANRDQLPALQAAMWNSGYVRYWFGIIPILRLLLIFMDYNGIRLLNSVIVLTSFIYFLRRFKIKQGWYYTGVVFLVLLLIQWWIFPLSLQYTPIFLLTLWGIDRVSHLSQHDQNGYPNWCLFLILGSLCNDIDLLTAPLLTFGLPFIIWLSCTKDTVLKHPLKYYGNTIMLALNWLVGYGLTWVLKWTIGSLILKENLFANAINQIGIRTHGTTKDQLHYGQILHKMWQTLLNQPVGYLLLVLLIIGLLALWLQRSRLHTHFAYWPILVPLLAVSLLPFLWVLILKNHNYHHYYFTYRIFAIPIFAMLCGGRWFISFDPARPTRGAQTSITPPL